MEEMNCKERLYAVLEQKPVDRTPCPAILQTGIVELMDACGAAWPEAFWDGEKAAKLSWAAYEIAGIEGVRVNLSVLTESEALGCVLFKWKKNASPMVKDNKEFAVKKPEDIDKVGTIDPKRDGRIMPATIKSAEILAPKCEKEKIPMTAMIMSPFTLATGMGVVDMMNAMIWLKKSPELIEKLIKKMTDVHVTYAEALADAGVDVILFNSGTSPESGVNPYKEIGFKYEKEAMEKDQKLVEKVILHSCSAKTVHFYDLFCDLGPHALSIAEMIPIKEAREKVGDRVALAGGVNQLTTLLKGSPEKVTKEAKKAIEDGIDILAPGCGFGPKTPLANMKAMVEAAKKYGMNGRLAKKG